MNKVILMGRLTREPDVRVTGYGSDGLVIARFTLAVDRRRTSQDGQREADFISCVAFGKPAEFVQRFLHTGTKIALNGRIQTGSYVNKDGQKVYTTDVVADELEFAESKAAADMRLGNQQPNGYQGRPQYQNQYQTQSPNPYSYQGQGQGVPQASQGSWAPQYQSPVNTGFMQQQAFSVPPMPNAPVMPAPAMQEIAESAPTAEAVGAEDVNSAAEGLDAEGNGFEHLMPAPEMQEAAPEAGTQDSGQEVADTSAVGQGFLNIPEGVEDETLPFN